jgi:hypothetical protein
MKTAAPQHHRSRRTTSGSPTAGDTFTSVYADTAASLRAAVAQLPTPSGVTTVSVDDCSMTDTFGCRIAVDLTAPSTRGSTARRPPGLTRATRRRAGRPGVCALDLLRNDSGKFC